MFTCTRFIIAVVCVLLISACSSTQESGDAVAAVNGEQVINNQIVEASCGQCRFGMNDKKSGSCDLAVRIDGKSYFVEGAHIDDFGDAHSLDGLCNAVRKARVTGTIRNDRFHASAFQVLSESDKPANQSGGIDFSTKSDLELGNFSISLAMKDINASRDFYEKLGFREIGGNQSQNWLIMRNGTTTIGLFQGLFEKNTLTFNPGWAVDGKHPDTFTDVRELQRILKERGLTLVMEVDPATSGPAGIMLMDPDGNPILIDQHRPRN